jgi:uncharacterized protein (TIGR04255 family)
LATPRHLSRAPITEALLDLRAVLARDFDVKGLEDIHDAIRDLYPKKDERRVGEFELIVNPGEDPKALPKRKGIHGYFFKSADDKRIVQCMRDGFTLNWLKPYESWEGLRDEAKKLWSIYCQSARPTSVTRIALRYINRLDIPLPLRDFSDFLTAPPSVPAALPQGVISFLSRVVTHDPSTSANAVITQAMEALVTPEVAPIVLDIDVYREVALAAESNDIWAIFEQLRQLKNKVFFESVTENTLELFI